MGLVDLLVVIAHNYCDMDAWAAKVAIANVYEWYEKIEEKFYREINRQTISHCDEDPYKQNDVKNDS